MFNRKRHEIERLNKEVYKYMLKYDSLLDKHIELQNKYIYMQKAILGANKIRAILSEGHHIVRIKMKNPECVIEFSVPDEFDNDEFAQNVVLQLCGEYKGWDMDWEFE